MLKIKNGPKAISIREADVLLERYYDGNTTSMEEKQLYVFLSQEHLPEQYNADRVILSYFSKKKQKPKQATLIPFMKWASIAAVIFGAILIAKIQMHDKETNYTYINGNKYTDTQMVKNQALASLDLLSSSDEDIENCASNLHDKDLVQAQLQSFSEE